MVRSPSCAKVGLNRGAWCASEDQILINYVNTHGEGRWKGLPQRAGLNRCGKSCRLRWLKYLRPDIKRGNISLEEEELIFRLHSLLGNRWSLIAGRLPGRTDNEIKNYWNSNLSKKLKSRATIKSGKQLNNWKETNPVGSSLAIRPKAVRCTRVFVPPEEGNQIAKNYLVSNWNGEGPSQLEGSSNSLMDLDMDMDMGDSFVANLLNSDFYQVYVDDETRSENHNIAGRDDGLMINNTSSSSDCPLSAHGDSTNATMLQDWTGSDLPLEPNFTLELKMLANFLYSEDDRME